MNEKQYVKAIIRKIKCSSSKKKEISRQLFADIQLRRDQGEELEEILQDMGSVEEIAQDFNESMSEKEKKISRREKWIKILIPIILLTGWYMMRI